MVKHRFQAQALVEFALVIMLLLVLIFGILEGGRLLFIYGAVVNASREAARYGSVEGYNEAGNLYYQDCAAIRNTARRVAFFQNLQDSDIVIQYDTGPGTAIVDTCTGSVDTGVKITYNPDVANSPRDRIIVTVKGKFTTVVRNLPFNNMLINKTSERTII